MWDLVPPIRDQTQAACIGSAGVLPTWPPLRVWMMNLYFPWTPLKVDSHTEAPTSDSTNPSWCYWPISLWPGSKSAHKPCCFRKTSVQITSFLSTSWGQRFSVTGESVFLASLRNQQPLSTAQRSGWRPQFGGPLGIETSCLPGKWEIKSLPHLRGKYLIESGILLPGAMRLFYFFLPQLSKVPIHTNYGSSQGLWVLGTTPVEGPLWVLDC